MKRAVRLAAICGVLLSELRAFRRFRRRVNPDAPERFVRSLIALGPVFVKLGQVLSTRPDIVPAGYVTALEQLQESQPPVENFESVREAVEGALGLRLDQVFSSFERTPVAAASLAQVHKARLLDNGRTVAVKVRRPGVSELVRRDLDALGWGLRWGERLVPRRLRRINLRAFFDEFRRYTLQELDFQNEGRTIDRFRENFQGRDGVHLPIVHWAQTTTAILTMDWVGGTRVQDAARTFDSDQRGRLVRNLVESLLSMFISHGLFHADLHPGNIRFHPDGSFTLLDFGMYGELTTAQRDRFILYWVAVVQRQPRRAFHHFMAQTRRLRNADEPAFYARFAELAERWYESRLSDLSFAQVYLRMIEAGYQYGFVFPRELMLHAKALTTAEALMFTLDPEVRFERISRPVIAREFVGRVGGPSAIKERLSQFLPELLVLGEVLPQQAVDVVWDRDAGHELLDEALAAGVDQIRRTLEHGGLWKGLLEKHARAALGEADLATLSDVVLTDTWRRYYTMEGEVPVASTAGAVLTTHLAVVTLALYRALVARDVPAQRAYQIIYAAGWRLYQHMGEPPLLLAAAYTRDPEKRLKIATDLFRAFPFGEPAYSWKDVQDEPGVVAFDCLRCPVADYFAQHGESDLCVHTWCELDFPLAHKWGGDLVRSGTLASGAARCDFRWYTTPPRLPMTGDSECGSRES